MEKKVKELLEECEKLSKENKELQQKLWAASESIDTIKRGNIDALVIANKKELKVYTEKTADKTYRILIEKMHEGAVTLNEDGTILYCNLSFANMVKLPLQKVIGAFFKNFLDNSLKGHFEDLLKQSRKKAITEEVDLYTNDSKALPVLMSLNTFLSDDTFVLSIILTDLTIQNKNQEELKWRAMELAQKNIELKSVNNELALQNVEKEKKAAYLLILSEDLKAQHGELRSANSELHDKTQLLLRQDEKMVRINDELLTLNQNLEKKVFERTLELENLNYELKHLNISKDKFLSVISHDLRNPLSSLLVASDELSRNIESYNLEDIRKFAEVIQGTSNNILQQLNELVDWAQIQRVKTALVSEKLHLAQKVDQSIALLLVNVQQKNIVLENKIPHNMYVYADALMLRSIFQNLITNAIKFTPEGGLIAITAQPVDKMVEICVADSGIGMEASVRQNLFINSHSAPVSGTNNEKGNGLGLKLVKDFVSQHGGAIRVESELGKGACVIFTMPIYDTGIIQAG